MAIALTYACVSALAALGLFVLANHVRGRTLAVRKRVVVNLIDDQALTGVLWRRHRDLLVLRSVQLMQPGREPIRMDGDVVIERDRINWVQIVGS
ncbi:hypothetical protein [Amycolatopsis lurida]|uniref:hypothetical protein n=1 Tax=Amycolatopsis lurida TaxID=31959 RepID=UPI003654DA65